MVIDLGPVFGAEPKASLALVKWESYRYLVIEAWCSAIFGKIAIDSNGIATDYQGKGEACCGRFSRPLLAGNKKRCEASENQLDTIDHVARHTLVPLEIRFYNGGDR